MSNRAKPIRRTKQPLTPTRSVMVVTGTSIQTCAMTELTADLIGLKALGLACIPREWTKPYFVVSGRAEPDQASISLALVASGMALTRMVMVRSSAINESLDKSGSLISSPCDVQKISSKIADLLSHVRTSGEEPGVVHWVIQELIPTDAKGHLSNERRLNKDLRDWTAEVEAHVQYGPEMHRIAIRTWRDATQPESLPLYCRYRANYVDRLEEVARWAYERHLRVHFEWVWDGSTIYIVQAAPCEARPNGVDPESLVQIPIGIVSPAELKIFRQATKADFKEYRKLANAALYTDLSYDMPGFYVLDNEEAIRILLEEGRCSDEFHSDLKFLTSRPLVIRTDGRGLPAESRQMLPRSDELRSVESALQWLIKVFRNKINDADLAQYHLCFIAHHFIPAAASAWCQASPKTRRVRIESLWGIPEGLYWYAHDVFDVDTLYTDASSLANQPKNLKVRERTRFKGRFIAPDSNGAWVVHETNENSDWKRSIKKTEWIEEIAWATRLIAEACNMPVVVMWFIDIPPSVSKHKVLPWYHEAWEPHGHAFTAAPRDKRITSEQFTLETNDDWKQLQQFIHEGNKYSRILVNPIEPEIVRDQEFAKSLAKLAKEQNLIIELSGGILSHAYYMLSSQGCIVECTDLDEYALENDQLEFNKLVRDEIPDSISARGESVEVYKLEDEALILSLRRKLVEEALEVMDAPTTIQITEELADLYEVIFALSRTLSISTEEIENARANKAKKRGVFEKGLMLSRTSLAAPISSARDDLLSGHIGETNKTLTLPSDLPKLQKPIHVDKRIDEKGTHGRQFMLSIPVYLDGVETQRTTFSFETPEDFPHVMLLDAQIERVASDFRIRLTLTNTPTQLELSLLPPSKDHE